MTHLCFTQTLPQLHQRMTVEYIREADWDRHWALCLYSSGQRREIQRLASYSEARAVLARRAAVPL